MMALKVRTMIIRAEIALFCNLGPGPRDKKIDIICVFDYHRKESSQVCGGVNNL
jgi:hypothetical protein